MKIITIAVLVLSLAAISFPAHAESDVLRRAAERLLMSQQAPAPAQPVRPAPAATSTQNKSPAVSAALSALSNKDISAGLREALSIGTTKVVQQLGKTDGFNLDPQVRIPLPSSLQKVDQVLSRVGMGYLTDDLELRLNRAAEAATPKARTLFLDAIKNMTIEDARKILSGPNDAATQYLRSAMGPSLLKEIQPIIQTSLAQAGALKAYDQVLGQYSKIPLVSGVKTNLQSYAAEKTLDGIFYYVAREEAAIRANPAKRTTDLLKQVFGRS